MTEEKKKLPEEAGQDYAGETAEERTIIAVMKRKWGEKNVEDFSKRCPDAYSVVVRELSAEMDYFVGQWHDPGREHRHEHVKSLFAKTVTRWVLMRVSQALIAHLINRAQGIQETEKNFFTEYQIAFPYIEEALKKHPDAPGHMGPGTKQQVDVFIWEINEENDDIEAVYNGTFNTPCAAVLKDAAEAIRKDREAAREATERKRKAQEKARESIDEINLKDAKWLNIYHGKLNDEIMRLSGRDFTSPDGMKGYWTGPDKQRYDVNDIDKLFNGLQTSTKKIFDVAVMYLSMQNFYGSGRNSIKPQVRIPLLAYLEKNGHDLTPRTMATEEEQAKENARINTRIKKHKSAIRKDFDVLSEIRWTGEEKQGRNAGDYANLRLISGHRIRNGFIYVNFDVDAAYYLVNAYSMWFPLCLLLHDNRRPNSYSIGRKILLHTSIKNNFFAGTDCTLSAMALLNAAPEITTIEELQERGQRNWKDKIKKPLEAALNDNVSVGFLKRWEYRHPKSGITYTPEEAQALTWEVYSALMIDFVLTERPPGETDRRTKWIEEKAAAEAAGKITQKKRGRPRKKAQTPKKDTK